MPETALAQLRAAKSVLGVKLLDGGGKGILVSDSKRYGPFLQSFVIDGDFIVEIGGTPVFHPSDVRPILDKYTPGDAVVFSIRRGVEGNTENVVVEIGGNGLSMSHVRELRAKAGLKVESRPLLDKHSALIAYDALESHTGLTLEDSRGGVQISVIDAGSPAARARPHLKEGYFLTGINGERVRQRAMAESLLQAYRPGEIVALEFKLSADTPPRTSQIEIGARQKSVAIVRSLREMAGFVAVSATNMY